GEVVVDEPAEVLLEEPHHRERQPRRHQRGALLVDVTTVEDRPDDRCVRRRPADLPLFQLADQGRLGETSRWTRLVPGRLQRLDADHVALGELGQPRLTVVTLLGVVGTLDVRLEETVEGDHAPRAGELARLTRGRGRTDPDGNRLALKVSHLRGDG